MKELTYTKHGDYYLPNLTYPTTKPTYGKYGIMREDYLKQHNPGLWNRLMLRREADRTSERDRQDGAGADRTDDAGTDERRESDGGTESDRPTQMGGLAQCLTSLV